eukprot:2522146-Pleurochrysis_carterae.AAC.1
MADLIATHHEHSLMLEDAGSAEDKPVELAVMFDGFPIERIFICHFCVANAGLRPVQKRTGNPGRLFSSTALLLIFEYDAMPRTELHVMDEI